jgi:ferredoxin
MSMVILEDCTSCGLCVPECPTESITEGDDIFVVNAETCNECEDQEGESHCIEVCPVDCIEPDGKGPNGKG